MGKKISIIIPMYNSEKTIKKCLESIINQTYKNIEVLIINDGSKDKSENICYNYAKKDKRIKVFSKENGGVSSARNYGLEKVTGDFISFIDSDDYIEKNMYERIMDEFKRSNCDVVICNYLCENIDGNEYLNYKHENFMFKRFDYPFNSSFIKSISGYTCNKVYSRKVIYYDSKNFIKFNTNISIAEDDLFNFTIIKNNIDIIYSYIDDKLYHYVINPNSATNKKFNLNKLSYFDAKKEEIEFLEDNGYENNYLKADFIINYIRATIMIKKAKIKPNEKYYHIIKDYKKYKKSIKLKKLPTKLKIKYLIAVYFKIIYRIYLIKKYN